MTPSAAWIQLALLALLVGLTIWLDGVLREEAPRQRARASAEPDVIVDRFTAKKLGADGAVRYTLNAKSMRRYPGEAGAVLAEVEFEANLPDRPKLTATAPRGTVSASGDEVVLEEHVVVKGAASGKSPAWTLTTPKLTLLPDQQRARSNSGVVLNSDLVNLHAASFELDTDTRIIRFKDVQSTYLRRPS